MTTYNVTTTSSSITLGSGDVMNVLSGGTAFSTLLEAGSNEYVYAGGVSNGSTVNTGGDLNIFFGETNNTTINSGGSEINYGGTENATTVNSGGSDIVSNSGTVDNTKIESGGYEAIISNGVSNNVLVDNQGLELVSNGGLSNNTTVASGGIEILADGGSAQGTTVESGGYLIILPNGNPSGTDVGNGGHLVSTGVVLYQATYGITLYANLVNMPTISMGDIEYDLPIGIINNPVIEGGILEVAQGSTITGAINFSGSSGELIIDPTSIPSNTIAGFGPGDGIEIVGVTYAPGDAVTVIETGVVQLKADNNTYDLNISGATVDENDYTFGINSLLTETTVPCYCRGTWILTDNGERRIEDLSIGDTVLTFSGVSRQIKWIGYRSYVKPFLSDNINISPILIKAGALRGGIPNKDLWVSPLHSLYIKDLLVPAALLVDGKTILQCFGLENVDYIHIELHSHDIIFANGAPAETFIDYSSRLMFQNANDFFHLYPNDTKSSWELCAPKIEGGDLIKRIRAEIIGNYDYDKFSGGSLEGELDQADPFMIRGWAWSPDVPNLRIELEIMDNDCVLSKVIADEFRSDLHEVGIGDGRHGFHLSLGSLLPPWIAHTIYLRHARDLSPIGRKIDIPQASPYDLFQTRHFNNAIVAALNSLSDISAIDEMLVIFYRHTEMARHIRNIKYLQNSVKRSKRALFIDQRVPDKERDAGSVALLGHMQAFLVLGYQVEFVAACETHICASQERTLLKLGVVWHRAPTILAVEHALRQYGADLDIVYLHRLDTVQAYIALCRQTCPKAKIIYSLADLHYLRIERQAVAQQRPDLCALVPSIRRREIEAILHADIVFTHSTYEERLLKTLLPNANIHILRWPIATNPHTRRFKDRRDIGFIGGGDHAPNSDGVAWLIRDIMPLVWQKDPMIKLHIAGANWHKQKFYNVDPRVTFHGRISQLDHFLSRIKITVAPLRFGAGVKGKVLESFGAGVPCVMTNIASEGIELCSVINTLVQHDAAGIAAKINDIYHDNTLYAKAKKAGLSLVSEQNAIEAIAASLRASLAAMRQSCPIMHTVAQSDIKLAS